MLNHRIRGLLFRYKKKNSTCSWLLFFGKSIQKRPDSVCEDDVNNEQNVLAHYMPNHWMRRKLFYRKKKKKHIYYFGFYFLLRVSKTSYSSVIVAPFESAGIRPVVNRLNQDTTVYYGLVFCAFSWPYAVVKDNSWIVNPFIASIFFTRAKCTCLK